MKKCLLFIGICLNGLLSNSQGIVSVKPNYVNPGDSLSLTITGIKTQFSQIGKTMAIYFKDYFSNIYFFKSCNVINDTSLTAVIIIPKNSFTGYWNLFINEFAIQDRKYGKLNALYIDNTANTNPEILKINQNTGKPGQKLKVSITGLNTNFGGLNYFVCGDSPSYVCPGGFSFIDYDKQNKGVNVDSFKVYRKDSMKVFLNISSKATLGYNNINVIECSNCFYGINYGKNNAFYVDAPMSPKIISINPNNAINNQTLNITLKGKNTHFTKFKHYNYDLQLYSYIFPNYYYNNPNYIKIDSVKPVNDTIMIVKVTIPEKTTNGYRDLIISDSASSYINYGYPEAFWVGPYLSEITPNQIQPGISITIDMATFNANFTGQSGNNILVWLSNFDGYNPEIDATQVVVEGSQLISATFNIPSDIKQGLWDVYIADTSDGVFYRNSILQIGEVTSVNENKAEKNDKLKIFPNPFNDDIFVEYTLENSSPVILEIFNITGVTLFSMNLGFKAKGDYREKLNAGQMGLCQGIYLLKLNVGEKTYMSKIVRL